MDCVVRRGLRCGGVSGSGDELAAIVVEIHSDMRHTTVANIFFIFVSSYHFPVLRTFFDFLGFVGCCFSSITVSTVVTTSSFSTYSTGSMSSSMACQER